jgi:hypothetical protein
MMMVIWGSKCVFMAGRQFYASEALTIATLCTAADLEAYNVFARV